MVVTSASVVVGLTVTGSDVVSWVGFVVSGSVIDGWLEIAVAF